MRRSTQPWERPTRFVPQAPFDGADLRIDQVANPAVGPISRHRQLDLLITRRPCGPAPAFPPARGRRGGRCGALALIDRAGDGRQASLIHLRGPAVAGWQGFFDPRHRIEHDACIGVGALGIFAEKTAAPARSP